MTGSTRRVALTSAELALLEKLGLNEQDRHDVQAELVEQPRPLNGISGNRTPRVHNRRINGGKPTSQPARLLVFTRRTAPAREWS